MDTALPPWVEAAAQLSVAFAQVREDAELDAWVVRQVGKPVEMLLVASGGCTVAYLATLPEIARLHAVDPNPAQLALTRLKLQLLHEEPEQRLPILGHRPLPTEGRIRRVNEALGAAGMAADALGAPDHWASLGPSRAGRYERVFAQLRWELVPHLPAIRALMSLQDPAEQAHRVAPETELGRALDAAFEAALALPILVRLFGEGATRNPAESFATHFARRTRHVLATLPAATNPYLAKVLLGEYPSGVVAPYLKAPRQHRLPPVDYSAEPMTQALTAAPAGSYDVVHLSNILDWLTPEEAQATLDLAHKALKPGGWVFIRQLNSRLDIPAAGPGFAWQADKANRLHARDRSYFYRALHLGRKR